MPKAATFITPPARATRSALGPREPSQANIDNNKCEQRPDRASQEKPTTKRPLTSELTPRRRRKRRREKREHIVPDPCQRAEQLRLLSLMPTLDGLIEHDEAPPPDQLAPGTTLPLGGDEQWRVGRLLGEGAFARVYLVTRDADRRFANLKQLREGATEIWRRLSGGGETAMVGAAPAVAAAKVSCPAAVWEWYMHGQIRERLAAEEHRRFLLGLSAHAYGPHLAPAAGVSASVLLLPVAGPTLQQLLDRLGGPLPEPLALFYTMELARALHALHAAGLMHCDLKPDNVALRAPRRGPAAIDAAEPLRGSGWEGYGTRLFDFGRGLDLRRYPHGTRFQGDAMADGFECLEMRRRQTWTLQVDSFALCATAHALRHEPEKMTLESVDGRWRPRTTGGGGAAAAGSARGEKAVAAGLWRAMFDEALNVPSGGPHPNLARLADNIESFFDARRERREALKAALQKQQSVL